MPTSTCACGAASPVGPARRPLLLDIMRTLPIVVALILTSCGHRPTAPPIANNGSAVTATRWLEALRPPSSDAFFSSIQSMGEDSAAAPPGELSIPLRAVVDDYPAWSPDGKWIAFHRRYPSSYGPPGLYVVSSHGGAPRFLLAGGFFFPREMSFSPDGERLVCSNGNQLVFVNIASGIAERPMYTDNGAAFPDWSPDGHSIAYARIFLNQFPPEPPDSAGLHVFDLASGMDRPLYHHSTVLGAGPVRWVQGGAAVAVSYALGGEALLNLASLDGQLLIPLLSVPSPQFLWNLQHLEPAKPTAGPRATESLVTLVIAQAIERTLEVTINPKSVVERRRLGLWDALSSTGREVVAVRPDSTDSLVVLFVGKADSPGKPKLKQLTQYLPP